VNEKLANNFKIVTRVLMAMATEGRGQLGHGGSVILYNKIIDVVVVVTSIVFSI
jgi:hypothetical protein